METKSDTEMYKRLYFLTDNSLIQQSYCRSHQIINNNTEHFHENQRKLYSNSFYRCSQENISDNRCANLYLANNDNNKIHKRINRSLKDLTNFTNSHLNQCSLIKTTNLDEHIDDRDAKQEERQQPQQQTANNQKPPEHSEQLNEDIIEKNINRTLSDRKSLIYEENRLNELIVCWKIRQHYYPEGGWGWIVMMSACISHMITRGLQWSFNCNIFILRKILPPEDRIQPETIGYTLYLTSLLSSPLTISLCSKSIRLTALLGGIICFLGSLFASFSFAFHQLLLSFCLLSFGISCVCDSSQMILGKYFKKKRIFLETWIGVSEGFGTIIVGILLDYLLRNLGWRKSYQIVSILMIVIIFLAGLYRSASLYHPQRRAIQHLKHQKKKVITNVTNRQSFFDFRPFHSRQVVIIMWSVSLASFAKFLPILRMNYIWSNLLYSTSPLSSGYSLASLSTTSSTSEIASETLSSTSTSLSSSHFPYSLPSVPSSSKITTSSALATSAVTLSSSSSSSLIFLLSSSHSSTSSISPLLIIILIGFFYSLGSLLSLIFPHPKLYLFFLGLLLSIIDLTILSSYPVLIGYGLLLGALNHSFKAHLFTTIKAKYFTLTWGYLSFFSSLSMLLGIIASYYIRWTMVIGGFTCVFAGFLLTKSKDKPNLKQIIAFKKNKHENKRCFDCGGSIASRRSDQFQSKEHKKKLSQSSDNR